MRLYFPILVCALQGHSQKMTLKDSLVVCGLTLGLCICVLVCSVPTALRQPHRARRRTTATSLSGISAAMLYFLSGLESP